MRGIVTSWGHNCVTNKNSSKMLTQRRPCTQQHTMLSHVQPIMINSRSSPHHKCMFTMINQECLIIRTIPHRNIPGAAVEVHMSAGIDDTSGDGCSYTRVRGDVVNCRTGSYLIK